MRNKIEMLHCNFSVKDQDDRIFIEGLNTASPLKFRYRLDGTEYYQGLLSFKDIELLRKRNFVEIQSIKPSSVVDWPNWVSQSNRFVKTSSFHSYDPLNSSIYDLYLNLVEIRSYLALARYNLNGSVRVPFLPNNTHEQGPCSYIVIGDTSRKSIDFLITAGIHGNEWAGPETAVYFVHYIIRSLLYNTDLVFGDWSISADCVKSKLYSSTIAVVPCVNQDGFHFSKTYRPKDDDDALNDWRKNRNPEFADSGVWFWGTDVNRNFDFLWQFAGNVNFGHGNGVFHGTRSRSEPETKNITYLIGKLNEGGIYVDLHAPGNIVAHPWAHAPFQSNNPNMNFRTHPAPTSCLTSGYKEYVNVDDSRAILELAQRAQSATNRAGSRVFDLAPLKSLANDGCGTGLAVDYAFALRYRTVGPRKLWSLLFEISEDWVLPLAKAKSDIAQACAGLAELYFTT